MPVPQVIFLDAVGTLFGVRGTVGEIYSRFADEVGVSVDPEVLNTTFIDSFLAAPRAAFPGVDDAEIPEHEFAWWQAIAQRSFAKAGVLDQFTDFEVFFQPLFDHFATTEPWIVYPEVPQVLEQWQRQGIELGIVSNFDSRLHQVLKVLDLGDFFTSVTISTAVGAAKPHRDIFAAALAKHECKPQHAVHIGDSWQEDYQGAIALGLKGVWLNRKGSQLPQPSTAEAGIPHLSRLQFRPPE